MHFKSGGAINFVVSKYAILFRRSDYTTPPELIKKGIERSVEFLYPIVLVSEIKPASAPI